LKKMTAGIATARPRAVSISASPICVLTVPIPLAFSWPIFWKAAMIPMTVPQEPDERGDGADGREDAHPAPHLGAERVLLARGLITHHLDPRRRHLAAIRDRVVFRRQGLEQAGERARPTAGG
jgi:hypothetical protein